MKSTILFYDGMITMLGAYAFAVLDYMFPSISQVPYLILLPIILMGLLSALIGSAIKQ